MKTLIKIFLPFCLFFTLSAQTYTGTVVYVKDGDTFVFQTQEGSLTIRMQGIDTPEKNQPWGSEATAFLMQYKDKQGRVEATGVDKYGRTLGVLFVDKENVNYLSVLHGHVWHYTKYSSDEKLTQAEKLARKEKRGLWIKPNPIAPWEWRKNNR